jgi:hypothetical protein
MPKISQASNNWPENPVVEASDYNDLYTDIENVSATIGDGNVRTEGVHTRNLVPNVICIEQASQYNGYEAELGASPIPAATNYGNLSDDSTRESPINHNSGGFASTVPGQGTKMIIGDGTNGVSLQAGDVIRLTWQVKVWKPRSNTNSSGNVATLNMHASDLITTAARSDSATDGSGMGEWCYLIYPKANVTSNALNDADFDTLDDANLYYAVVLDPPNESVGLANAVLMAGAKFDHCSVVDMCHLAAGNTSTSSGMVFAATGDDISTSDVRRPYTISGGITMKATQATTLFGFQLYTSGVWRWNATTTQGALYLEDVECDPVNNRFGVSMSVTYEAASLECMIFRGV